MDATGTEWYAPSSYTYNDTYVTPYPSSTVEAQPWTSSAPTCVHDVPMLSYPYQHQQFDQPLHLQPGFRDPSRPKSSPSTFGPSADNIAWPAASGLGIQYGTSTAGQSPPVTSAFLPSVWQTFPAEDQYRTASPPEIRQPQPRRPYVSIQPGPQSTSNAKRPREDDDQTESVTEFGPKRRRRTASVASADLSEDDRFLVQLKEDESLPWKDIANRFQSDKGKNFNVAALQMRYKRLREKFRVWEEQDVNALKLAHEYWERNKWDIISAKVSSADKGDSRRLRMLTMAQMLEYGLHERWPPRHCARKWQEIEAQMAFTRAATTGSLRGTPQVSSPVDGPVHHFGFVPMQ
ncbi:hypothetical protein Tdes44962_MAKER00629 [Teratosphaeria destructans]|uniref:Myb-like domain-containing protein n=1 Tax=Teratosphaeria destructans TaxID=418781 RepID=A0A9W7W0W4_9PEZI|nr:hypothetical protein Tdes44962_MAKER00629 [Teratosphaeria destructans]